MGKYVRLLRIKHYIKNFLILIPAFFGGVLLMPDTAVTLAYAFICFSMASSFIYIINDIRDCEKDRLHEGKRNRPIASGEISKGKAFIVAMISLIGIICMFVLLYGGFRFESSCIYVLVYIIMNLLYSIGLKNVPILDVMILAAGFVLRVLFGASVADVQCSGWLILTIMVISMYLGLGKRKNELAKVKDGTTRAVLRWYSVDYLDSIMKMCITLGVVFYSLWSVDIGGAMTNNVLIWTIPFVLAIIMKYQLDLEDNGSFGDPVEVIYDDKVLIVMTGIYIIVMLIIKYFV